MTDDDFDELRRLMRETATTSGGDAMLAATLAGLRQLREGTQPAASP